MKKILLITLSLFLIVGAIAQKKDYNAKECAKKQVIEPNEQSTQIAPKQVLKNKKESTVTEIGASGNAYGTYIGAVAPLFYDPYTNIFTFVHRGGGTVPATNSGHVFYNYSTDNGATFSTNVDVTPFMANTGYPAARFPSSIVLNPENSNNYNNNIVSATGVCLLKSTNTFGGVFTSSFNFEGNNIIGDTTFNQLNTYEIPSRVVRNANGTALWMVAENKNDSSITVLKGVSNGSNIVWSINAILHATPYVKDSVAISANIAFSPNDVNIGYVIAYGHFMDFKTKFQRPAHMAKIWKTTDGGLNWIELPDYDYGTVLENILYKPNPSYKVWPFMSSDKFDAVVDKADRLHLFGAVIHGTINECIYFKSYFAIPNEDESFIYRAQYMDFVTSNGNDMKPIFVEPVYTTIEPDFGAIKHRLQPDVSIDKNGEYLFFSWIKNVEDTMHLIEPNVYGRAMHYTSTFMNVPHLSSIKHLTASTEAEGTAYHKHATTYLQNNGDTAFNVPFSYVFLGNDDVTACTHYFHNGEGFHKNEVMVQPGVKDIVSIKLNPTIYPNPTKDILYIENVKDANVSIFNILGFEIAKMNNNEAIKTINMSDFANGTYYVKIYNNTEVVTQKIIHLK